MFTKVINELKLKDIEILVITEDNSKNETYDDLEIKTVNIKEWLINI